MSATRIDAKHSADCDIQPGPGVCERETGDTLHVVVYSVGEQNHGLFLSDVERIIRAVAITPVLDSPKAVMGVINVSGRVIPVISVREKLKLPARDISLADQFILARSSRRAVALAVDSVVGVIERPRPDVATGAQIVSGLEHVKGVVKLDDGLILIYDLDRFLIHEEQGGLDDAIEEYRGATGDSPGD